MTSPLRFVKMCFSRSKTSFLLIILVLQCAGVFLRASGEDENVIQQKPGNTSFGKIAILKADIVELEFKMHPATEFALPLGVGLRPEVSHETASNELVQETDRNSAFLGLKKVPVPGRLDLQIKPGVSREEQLFAGGQTSDAGNLDLNLNFGPNMVLSETLSAGAELGFHSRYDHINSLQTSEQTLFISLKGSF